MCCVRSVCIGSSFVEIKRAACHTHSRTINIYVLINTQTQTHTLCAPFSARLCAQIMMKTLYTNPTTNMPANGTTTLTHTHSTWCLIKCRHSHSLTASVTHIQKQHINTNSALSFNQATNQPTATWHTTHTHNCIYYYVISLSTIIIWKRHNKKTPWIVIVFY